MDVTTTKQIRYDIWTYRRSATNSNPAFIQTCCFDSVPLALCGVPSGKPAVVALSQYLTRLVERHEAEALFPGLGPEPCAECGVPAAEGLHQLVPAFTPNVNSDFLPMTAEVSDFMVPICGTGGACEERARGLLDQRLLDSKLCERAGAVPMELRRHCQVCGADEELRRCKRCRLVAYCGQVCQSQDWLTHKPYCRPLVPQ